MRISDMLISFGRTLNQYGDAEVVVDNISPFSVRLGFKDKDGQVHPMFERIGREKSKPDGMLHPENEYRPAETLIDHSYDKKTKKKEDQTAENIIDPFYKRLFYKKNKNNNKN